MQVPESWEGTELLLFFEALDDARAAYFNGVKVAATGTFPPQFRSGLGENVRVTLDPQSVRSGDRNVFALRVYQSDPRPYFSVAAPILLNWSRMEAIRMAGAWQYRPLVRDHLIGRLTSGTPCQARGPICNLPQCS